MAPGSAIVKAVAVIAGDPNVKGSLHFFQDATGSTHVTGRIAGLSPGLHGFHIHAFGDTTNGCISTGPHFNPLKGTMAPVLMRIGTPATGATYSLVRMEWLKFVWRTCRFRLQDRIQYSEELLLFTLILMISAEVDMSLARQLGILVRESACGVIALQSAV